MKIHSKTVYDLLLQAGARPDRENPAVIYMPQEMVEKYLDLCPQHRDFSGFPLMSTYSCKHLRPCIYTASGAKDIMEMADVILVGKSLKENMFFTLGYSAVSPLTWSNTAYYPRCDQCFQKI